MLDVNLVELLTLATSLVAAIGVLVVNAKLDKLVGKVATLEAGHHAHVNAPRPSQLDGDRGAGRPP